ncbi:Phosphoglycolate phosphatase, HAD superfamily [Paenibacillus sp. UNCCL117]|uniref:HAD family hydrolase n=1 Tax=unclassified Paenibacillus TaxID=185978 RepID=UPI00088FD090|nr:MULTISPECIES: HAD family hydrolase [unclassified Paenibacillus]SDC08033.1 Phosphoglycolate phosphatase, HAD superfamily [Paenibacillus sp. cl123]SFW38174.1 Phosphoglycolate phosphatase, HAD superfamily [Paenibacillus sp. UNCCL117]
MGTKSLPEAMIFDVDGTLFRTETLLLPAYHTTFDRLRSEGLFRGETPPEHYIINGLGMLLEHIWERVLPDYGRDVRRRADELLLKLQLDGLKRGEGELYEGVQETLQGLRERGVRLFTASNGLEAYVKGVIRHQGLEPLFEPDGLYSAGEFRTRSKVDLVKLLLEKHNIRSAWMVGDRSSDVEAGRENGLYVVGCDYAGFRKPRELEGADVRIASFSELLSLADESMKQSPA